MSVFVIKYSLTFFGLLNMSEGVCLLSGLGEILPYFYLTEN